MRYLFRATGLTADDVMIDATRKAAEFAGTLPWEFVEITARPEIMMGDGRTLTHCADVEVEIEV